MNETIEYTEEEIKVLQAIEILRDRYQFIPSWYQFHLNALPEEIISILDAPQLAEVVRLMQQAYLNGKAFTQAEKLDNDAVWVNGVGMLERQEGDNWLLTGHDAPGAIENDLRKRAASALGSARSETKAAAARANGRKGGRPRKDQE